MAEPIEPENGQTTQYRRELDAYNKWMEQDMSVRFTMLSCMHDNLIREYEKYPTAKELWEVLKVAYGSTSATRLRALTLRFNQYVLDPKHSMIQHLDVMKDMIRELQNAGCELSDEQQVLAVLSVASHLKLEADRRESERAQQAAFVAHAGRRKPHKGKRWNKPTVQDQVTAKAKSRTWPHKIGTHRTRNDGKVSSRRPIGSLAKVNLPVCEPCMAGKACRKPFGKAKKATRPLELVHSDICGPMNVRARHGAFYFLTFIDDYSRYGSVYLLSHRSKALECFKRFLAEISSRRNFPSISEVKGNLELYELGDPQGGASITVEGETPRYYPVINGDNESDPKLSGRCSLEEHNSQNSQMRISKRGGIPYEIEGESFMCASVDIDEPATYEEAVTSPNANEWITAMKEEMSSMAKNNVWELVDLPTGRKTIGNKWVLKVKRKANGSIDKFKARLVAKGYTQKEGIDYEETFSPVVRFASVRLILAIVAHLDLELFQMDVKTTFLNGELDEEIYMDQPEGNNMEMIVATQKWLSSTFEMKDMGEAEYILGVKIHRDRSKKLLSLSQETYIKRIIERFQEEKKRMTKIPYASAVGSLMYAMMCTRPDLCFAIGMQEAALHLFVYHGSRICCLYISSPRSYLVKEILKSLRISVHVDDAVVIYCDNTTAIAYAKDPKYHGRTKHIDTRYHFIRDSIAQEEVVLRHIPTNDMIADPFTKPLRREHFIGM
ncbi:UNVERIFIED_CONTAM: Retrovirus-related Pol polyprotein from transposon TNT 1-94 [Sesamum angustifolium]|uniref:Retrovirus-related Pol polyprotein from transposon TNT 1-94 n=1 Tax=Sesamum angustifolium TaxID=2727405 RepID=A0AAW2IS17_9LAMI